MIFGIYIGVLFESVKRTREAKTVIRNLYISVFILLKQIKSNLNQVKISSIYSNEKNLLNEEVLDSIDQYIKKASNLDDTGFFEYRIVFLLEKIKKGYKSINNRLSLNHCGIKKNVNLNCVEDEINLIIGDLNEYVRKLHQILKEKINKKILRNIVNEFEEIGIEPNTGTMYIETTDKASKARLDDFLKSDVFRKLQETQLNVKEKI